MKVFKNIMAVLVGLVIGSAVNIGLIVIGPSIIPPPEGFDAIDVESLAEGIHLFKPKHFLFPFLAQALGTFTGALLAYLLAATYKRTFAFAIGFLFLLGGIASIISLESPMWFTLTDLIFAYVPMAWLGTLVGKHLLNKKHARNY
ncbi:hypothetical protein [Sediminitomix flava]|nr:hypothetical protein [Sediminitomix flava]